MSFINKLHASLEQGANAEEQAKEGLGIDPPVKEAPIESPMQQGPTDPGKKATQTQEPLSPEDEQLKEQMSQDMVSDQIAPISAGAVENQEYVETDPNTWNPEDTQKGFIAKTGESLLRGFGSQVIGGAGDVLQMGNIVFGADVSDGNMASRWLQDVGNGIADEHQTYQSQAFRDQMENNAWNIKTAMHPDFWSTSVAEGIPMLIEMIFLSKGASGLAKAGAKGALKGIAKKQGRNVVEDVAGKVARGGGKDVLAEGGGVLRHGITKTGELTELGSGMADMIGGGVTMNMLAGLMNAAELVNTNKEAKDADGNPLYNEQELADMASASFTNNLMYLPIDALSWGITYGQAGKKITQGMRKVLGGTQPGRVGGMFSSQQSLKNSALTMGNATKSVAKMIGRTAKGLGKGVPEGMEETFQETFEEWAKVKAKAKIDGKEAPSYWEFYNSQENEATKAVSFALGMLGGAGSAAMNAMQQVDDQANQAYKLYDKGELLKNIAASSDPELKEVQIRAIDEMLINNKYHGDVNNLEYITGLQQKGIIDEVQYEEMVEKVKAVEQAWDNADAMNIKGKVAYATSIIQQAQHQSNLDFQKQDLALKTALYTESLKANPTEMNAKIKESQDAYNMQEQILEEAIGREGAVQDALVAGRAPVTNNKNFYGKDSNGNEIIFDGLSAEQYANLYEGDDQAILKAITDSNKAKRGSYGRLGDVLDTQGKKAYKAAIEGVQGVKEKMTKEKAPEEVAPVEEEVAPMEASSEEVANVVAKLKADQELTPEEEIIRGENTDEIEALLNQEIKTEENETAKETKPAEETKLKTDPTEKVVPVTEAKEEVTPTKADVEGVFKGKQISQKKGRFEYNPDLDRKTTTYEAQPIKGEEVTKLNQLIDKAFAEGKTAAEVYTAMTQEGYGLAVTKEEVMDYLNLLEKQTPKAIEAKKTEVKGKPLRKEAPSTANRIYFRDINSQEDMNTWAHQNIGVFERGVTAMNKATVVNSYLQKTFPGSNVRSYAIRDLNRAVGDPSAIGYSIGAVAFINEANWEQDEVFMHELSHIYYNITDDEEFTKAIIEKAKKDNPNLVKGIQKAYADMTLYRSKVDIDNEIKKGSEVSQADVDWAIENTDSSISAADFTRLPDSEQRLHNEEIFVNYLQGPLSKEYSKYFLPKNEPVRRVRSRKWWGAMKNSTDVNDAEFVANKMSKDFNPFNAESMLYRFKQTVKGPVNVRGRFSRGSVADLEASGKAESVRKTMDNYITAVENYDSKIANPDENTKRSADQLLYDITVLSQNENFEDTGMQNDNEQVDIDQIGVDWDKAYENIQARSGDIIEAFIKTISAKNRADINAKAKANNITPRYEEGIYGDISLRDFKSKLTSSAQETESPFEWMDTMLNPHKDNALAVAFAEFLQVNRGKNKYPILRSMHLVFNNAVTYPVVKGFIDENGYYSQDQALSQNEQGQVEWLVDMAPKRLAREEATQAYDNIALGQGTEQDYNMILATYGSKFIYQEKILENDSVNFKGGKTDLKTFLDHYIQNNVAENPELATEMVANIVATSRSHSSDAIVMGPNDAKSLIKKTAASKHLTNALSNKYKKIGKDLSSGMTRNEFLKKYQNMGSAIANNIKNNNPKVLATENSYMGWVYDNYHENGITPTLSMYVGDENLQNNKNISYKDSDANSLHLTDVLSFLHGDSDYLTSMNTFGDSKRRIMTQMKKYNMKAKTLGTQFNAELSTAYNIYASSARSKGEPSIKSFTEYKKLLQEGIDNQIKYFNDNSVDLMTSGAFQPLFDENGKLTKEAQAMVASHEISSVINKTMIHELITPSIPISSNIKRNKMNISPAMVLSPNMKIENVMIADEYSKDGYLANDSGQYITEATAKKLQDAGKGVIDLNYGFKLINYNVEKDNKKFHGKALALKGYTTILKEDEQAPNLKAIYDTLVERENRFNQWAAKKGKKVSKQYNDGGFDYIAIASPMSAEKGSLFTPKQSELLNGTDDKPGLASLEMLQSNADAYHRTMDTMHYDNNGDFVGFDGSNLGPQMRMDMQRKTAKVPVQLASGVLVGASALGQQAEAEAILTAHNEAIERQAYDGILKHVYELDSQGRLTDRIKDGADLAKFVLNGMNKQKANPQELMLLELDTPSVYNPRLNEAIKNQVRNRLIENLNNLRGEGTIAQQKSEIGGYQEGVGTEARSELKFYEKKANGDYKPMEGILPSYMEENTRAREYFSNEWEYSNALTARYKKEFGLKTREQIQAFVDAHKVEGKNQWYIPGDVVMVTRVPSSGPSFTGVMEVVGFDNTEASNIMVPSEFKSVVGSDDDGDQLFINKKGKSPASAEYNDFLDKMMNRWLSKDMHTTLVTPLDPPEVVNATIKRINDRLGRTGPEYTDEGVRKAIPFGSDWAKRNHNNALGASQTIGIAFNDHRLYNGLAAYGTELSSKVGGVNQPATIELGGQFESAFTDGRPGPDSRIHKSNTMTQIVLDSANNAQAEALGLNKYTIGHAMILTNLGFDLETIGMFLNQPVVKEYSERIASKGNLYTDSESQGSVLYQMGKDAKGNIWGDSSYFTMDFNSNSNENKIAALKLIKYLNGINSDLETINKVMKGHKAIDNDPTIADDQANAFEKLVTNNGKRSLTFSPEYKANPEAARYLKSLRTTSDVMGAMSIIHNQSSRQFYNEMQVAFGGNMADWKTREISKQLQIYNEAKFLGINQTWNKLQLEQVIDPYNESGLLQSYTRYAEAVIEDTIVFNEDNSSTSALDSNLFISKALVISEQSGELVLRTDQLAKDSSLTAKEIKDMQDGFQELPTDLQEKFIVADLVINEWKGLNSIVSFFGENVLNRINDNANKLNAKQDNTEANKSKLNIVRKTIINNEMNRDKPGFKTLRYKESVGEKSRAVALNDKQAIERMSRDLLKDNYQAILDLQSGANGVSQPEMYFNIIREDKDGNQLHELDTQKKFLKVKGYTATDKAKALTPLKLRLQNKTVSQAEESRQANQAILDFLTDPANGKMSIVTAEEKASHNIDLIAIKNDPNVTDDLTKKPLTQIVKKKPKPQRVGMAYRQDFHNFTGDQYMTEQQFHDVQQYKHPVSPQQRNSLYNQYLRDKEQANNLLDDFTDEKIKNMSDDTLLKHYKDYGMKNIYAFSNIMTPILLEINQRSMNEQSQLTNRYEDGQDVGFVKAWLQTNNIDSNHPATQAAQRLLETEFKAFTNEKKKYHREISKTTKALYAEKFGTISNIPYINRLARALKVLFTDRNKMYETLYGNITETINEVNYKGQPLRKVKLLSAEAIESGYANGSISKAEYDFAKMFRGTVNELASHKGKKDFATNGFIPAIGMSRMESFSHRGILGAFANSQTEDKAVHDVQMMFKGNEMSFKEIQDYFRTSAPNNFQNIKEYVKLELKAKKLLKKGLNEDGTKLEVSNVQNITMMGDGMIHRFSNDSFEVADDFMSMDLDKALTDFVHSSLFVEGNEKFSGFLKLQSVVDGLLMHNEQKGFKNQNSFVRKVYKEGFLKASRKEDTPFDKATDFITKWNLRYILGWKALAMQGGVYAVGNVIAGKYHNIKNSGGKAWITGEKRFWGVGEDGGKKASGVLDTLNILEFNVYDHVNMEKSQGLMKIFDEVAFAPMKVTEKWIQGTQFLGLLTDEQWNKFDKYGQYIDGVEPLTTQEILVLEEEVKRSQGKGYNRTDQRMIQQYSWGRAMLQFARFIPTMFYDRLSKDDVNIYGQETVGSLTQVGKTIRALYDGTMNPREFAAYRDTLSDAERKSLDAGLRGMGISAVALAAGVLFNVNTANELAGDANYIINPDKMSWKIVPSPVRTIGNMLF